MSCDRIPEDLILAFVLGETAPHETRRVDDHLRRCAACQSEVELLRRVTDAEAAGLPHSPENASVEALLPLLQRQARSHRAAWSMRRRGISLGMAAVAILALVFGAGYVQGKLVAARGGEPAEASALRAQALPPPPELGLLTVDTTSTHRPFAGNAPEALGVVPPGDSL